MSRSSLRYQTSSPALRHHISRLALRHQTSRLALRHQTWLIRHARNLEDLTRLICSISPTDLVCSFYLVLDIVYLGPDRVILDGLYFCPDKLKSFDYEKTYTWKEAPCNYLLINVHFSFLFILTTYLSWVPQLHFSLTSLVS